MKQLSLLCLSALLSAGAFSQVKMPAPSPLQVTKQDFATGSIEFKYSRPSSKGRKVFGDLVPYNKMWRTGANAATTIHFSEPVEIKGKKLDSGTYALYTIPNLDNWDVIFNKGAENSGIVGYKESDDVLRVNIEPQRLRGKLETFTIQVDNVKPMSCDLQLMWEKTLITIPVSSDITGKIKEQIAAAMLTDKKPYWQAAQFYFEYEKNSQKALENVTKAVAERPTAYWMWLYKAKIQQDLGDIAGAKESSKKSMELAVADKNNDYIKLNQDLQRKLK